tara:strand:+ start:8961 stop:9137 length:177 start_codon:yes stop_codon:yes gene_type:complete
MEKILAVRLTEELADQLAEMSDHTAFEEADIVRHAIGAAYAEYRKSKLDDPQRENGAE